MASSALASSSSAGYAALKSIATDSQNVIRRKAAFLIGTLIMQSGEKYEGDIPKPVVELIQEMMNSGEVSEPLVEGLKREGVIGQLSAGLAGSDDVEYEENAMRALSRAVEKGVLSTEEVGQVKAIWTKWGSSGQAERGLDGQDGQDIEKLLA
jgi:hsp70-interacting protein